MATDRRAFFRDLVAGLLADWPLRSAVIGRDTGPVPERGRVYPHLRCNLVLLGRQRLECGSGGRSRRHELPPEVAFVGLPHAWDRTLRRRYRCRTLGLAFTAEGPRIMSKDFRQHHPQRRYGADHELQLPADDAITALGPTLHAIARDRGDETAGPLLATGLHLLWRLVAERLARPAEHEPDPAAERWRRARRWMQEHCHRPITRDDVAAAVGITPSHCSVLFRRFAPTGFHRSLTALRIERAQALLTDPALGIAEVAARSGFEHPTTFARAFRRVTGQRPSRWRLDRTDESG